MMWKKTGSIVLAGLILTASLGGCGSSGQQDTGSAAAESSGQSQAGGAGRFMEEEVSLPEGYVNPVAVRVLSDGTLCAAAEKDGACVLLKSSDMGDSWEPAGEGITDAGMVQTSAIAPDGSAVFSLYQGEGEEAVTLYNRTAEGDVREVQVKLPGQDNAIWQLEYDAKGALFAMDYSGTLLEIDLSDGSCREPFDMKGSSASYFGIAGTTLLAVNTEGIALFDTESGERKDSETVLDQMITADPEMQMVTSDSGFPVVFTESPEGDGILMADHDGIFHFVPGGTVKEQLVDGSLSSLSAGELVLSSLAAADASHLFLTASGTDGKKLLRYTYDETASAVPGTELTVYSLYESSALRQGISVFQKENPDIYVNLQIGLPEDDSSVTLEDTLKVLNTDILAGKGPDVLILDDMPVQSYIDKGILADISDIVEEVDAQEGLFANIKEGSKASDGKIYAMPARFIAEFMQGDADTVQAAGNLTSLADRVEQLKGTQGYKRVLPEKGAEAFLFDLYRTDSAGWLKENGELDTDKIRTFFTQAKRLSDVDGSENVNLDTGVYTAGMTNGMLVGTLSTMGVLAKSNLLEYGTMCGMDDLQLLQSIMTKVGNSYGLLDSGECKTYIPSLLLGVNAAGDVENARTFVRTLLGSSASMDNNGFPVNRTAYDGLAAKKIEDKEEVSLGCSVEGSDEMVELEYIPLTQEHVNTLTGLLESLDQPALMDGVIRNLVIEQGTAYITGQQSLEDTLETVQTKASLYLSE